MIRVLHYLDSLDWKGEEMVIMNYYRKVDTTKVRFDFITRSKPGCRFQEEIEARGGKVYFLPSREKHPVLYVHIFRQVLKEGQYSVLHLNKSGASVAIDALIGKSCGVPVVIAHSHNSFCSGLVLHRLCKLFVNNVVDYRLACSEAAGEWVFGKRDDVEIVHNAIDPEMFTFNEDYRNQYRAELGICDKFVVGFVGRLENQKTHYA